MSTTRLGHGSSVAARLVLAWVRFYTRDVVADEARPRRAELESDVWEQINDPDVRPGARSAFLLWRAIRSVPADLAWRFWALRMPGSGSTSLFERWEHGGLAGAVLAEGFAVSGLLAAVVVHLLRGGNAGSLGADQLPTVAILAAALAFAVFGVRLLLQRAVRWIGSVLVGGASIALMVFGGHAMVRTSTTVAAVYYSTPFLSGHPSWSDLLHVSLAVLGMFHLSVALSWAPPNGSRGEAMNR